MDEHGIKTALGTGITFIVIVGIGPLFDYIKEKHNRHKKDNCSPEGTDKQLSKLNNTYIISRGKEKKQI